MKTLFKSSARYLALIISGSLITLSLHPFDYWPLAFISAGLAYWLCRNWRDYFAFYAGLFLSGTSWVYVSISEFGNVSNSIAIVATLIFCLGIAAISASLWLPYLKLINAGDHSHVKTTRALLSWASMATLVEWIRSWLFTGFPWLYAGYSQTTAPLAGLSPIGGVYLSSFMIYFCGAFIGVIVTRYLNRSSCNRKSQNTSSKKIFLPSATITLSLLILAFALNDVSWTKVSKEAQSVSLVQANISQHDKWLRNSFESTLDTYKALTLPALTPNNLIIWPEAAIPALQTRVAPWLDEINKLTRSNNNALLLGIPYQQNSPEEERGIYNGMLSLGNAKGYYLKQRLVPFGEYVPLEDMLGAVIDVFEIPLSSMESGSVNQAPLTIFENLTTLPLICYEVVYPDLAVNAAKQSNFLLTVSNDAWFGKSIGPLQHLQMAQMRAKETGRYMVRATGTGVSAIIDEHGRISDIAPQFEKNVLSSKFYSASGETPWVLFGSTVSIPAYFAILMTCLITIKSKKKTQD